MRLDDWLNTYIGLYVRSAPKGHLKYGEYDPYGKHSEFNTFMSVLIWTRTRSSSTMSSTRARRC